MHKFSVKLFFTPPSPHLDDFVPIFHSWIQTYALAAHLLIDVADYKHVINGPGIVLVAHEANLSIDQEDNRPGLLYFRKAPLPGSLQERLRATISAALQAAQLLQHAFPTLSFATSQIPIRIHDRLAAPNTAETFSAVRADFQAVANALYGQPVTLEYEPRDSRSLFEITIKSAQSPSIADLLRNIQKQ